MDGKNVKLFEFMDGRSKRFVIPVYQRNYDWKKENCKQLYEDLIRVVNEKRNNHFFGSIVSEYETKAGTITLLIIDGQQRLTTLSLMLLAMYNLISESIVVPKDTNLASKILKGYLIDEYESNDTRIKLKPVKNDQIALQKLFGNSNEYITDSNITANYYYFYDRIKEQEISIDQLFDAFTKLEIIDIRLGKEDDAQLIFESLNSTGLDLSEGDKIRNYILMHLPLEKQNSYYEKYWNPIELYTKYNVSSFVRDYLSVKQQITPPQNKIYNYFKDYVNSSSLNNENLLKDMLVYAKRYKSLLFDGIPQNPLESCIFRLNRLETTVTRPFFLEVLRMNEENKINIDETTEIFQLVESYIFRRLICSLPTNSLNKLFLKLHNEIIKYDNSENNYFEKFKYSLLSKKDRARFPSDFDFITEFSSRNIYSMNSKNKIYILERFENFETLEDKDIYRHYDDGIYSIEHIMPQELSDEWKRGLGADSYEIHAEWLHRIANLTLTAYNSKYSNCPFEKKKNMEHGYKASGLRLNTFIGSKEKWSEKELEERDKLLMNMALAIWKLPETTYHPLEKQFDTYTLEDDFDSFTGKSIVKFAFKNKEQNISSWIEMYIEVLRILYNEDKSILMKQAVSEEKSGLPLYFSLNNEANGYNKTIGNEIHIWTNTSTSCKLSILSKLFKLYELEFNDLVFYLEEEKL